MADKDVQRALMEALGMDQRPRTRPPGFGSSEMDLSPDEEKALEMILRMREMKNQDAESKSFPPASMMKSGGAVTKKTKKPKMGVVMKGRGGSYKGMK